jgi:predicted component of viral defense system (DUF524 family)
VQVQLHDLRMDSKKPIDPKASKALIESEGIDKVREILFGSVARQQDSRLHSFQAKAEAELGIVRRELSERVDSLSEYVKREIGSLVEKHESAMAKSDMNLARISKLIDAHYAELNISSAEISKSLSHTASELRTQILDSVAKLSRELHDMNSALAVESRRETMLLQAKKIDRNSLSDVLIEAAQRLKQ